MDPAAVLTTGVKTVGRVRRSGPKQERERPYLLVRSRRQVATQDLSNIASLLATRDKRLKADRTLLFHQEKPAHDNHIVSLCEDGVFVSTINILLCVFSPDSYLVGLVCELFLLHFPCPHRNVGFRRLSVHTIQSMAWRRHNSLVAAR